MLHIGQKVVCIAESFQPMVRNEGEIYNEIHPTKGQVYTIRGVRNVMTYGGTVTGVWLEEIVNRPRNYLGGVDHAEMAFDARAFRPLTSISVFEEMLTPAPKEKVRA
jgi:hypothetical protein